VPIELDELTNFAGMAAVSDDDDIVAGPQKMSLNMSCKSNCIQDLCSLF